MPDRPIVLVVRHPDYGNDYTVDHQGHEPGVSIIDIDLGASFDGTPDHPADAEEFAENIDHWLRDVPVSSRVFSEVIDVVRTTVDRYPTAVEYIDRYVQRREEEHVVDIDEV